MSEIICGDCLQVLPTLPDSSVDLVLTDPPYFKVKGDAWDRQWDKPGQFLLWLDAVVEQFARVLKPNGSLYLFASPQMGARVECQIAARLNVLNRIRWTKSQGWHQKAQKEALRSYLSPWEEIIFAEQGYEGVCEPIRAYLASERDRAGWTTRRVAEAYQRKTGSRTVTGMAGHWFERVQWTFPTEENYEWLRRLLNSEGGVYLPLDYKYLRKDYEELRRPFAVTADVPYTDVWDFPTVQAYPGKHPCEKPQALLRHIITASSRPGAVVLDAFAGTGSTGMACKALGREFIGIEMSEAYAATARNRIAATDAQSELFAA